MAKAVRFSALTTLVLALSAAPAWPRASGIHVASLPGHVLQGKPAALAVTVRPAGTACSLRVRYHGGTLQTGLRRVVATHGRAAWAWTVPTSVQAGQATATVTCGRHAGSLTRRFVVVGRLVEPKIVVEKSGFSTRPSIGGGTRLSYGLVLHNSSGSRDASNLTVQTNFVLADDHLLGTDTRRVDTIGAGADFALGNTISFPGSAPVTRLEVVVQVRTFVPHTLRLPTLANIHLVPKVHDTGWLGTVEGELQNTDPTLVLGMTSLSAVVFDAQGDIVGGGTGFATDRLPPGAREFLKLSSGFDVIPFERAASTMVSLSPSWAQPGA